MVLADRFITTVHKPNAPQNVHSLVRVLNMSLRASERATSEVEVSAATPSSLVVMPESVGAPTRPCGTSRRSSIDIMDGFYRQFPYMKSLDRSLKGDRV